MFSQNEHDSASAYDHSRVSIDSFHDVTTPTEFIFSDLLQIAIFPKMFFHANISAFIADSLKNHSLMHVRVG